MSEGVKVAVTTKTHELMLCPTCAEDFLIRRALFVWYIGKPGVNTLTCPRGHQMTAVGAHECAGNGMINR